MQILIAILDCKNLNNDKYIIYIYIYIFHYYLYLTFICNHMVMTNLLHLFSSYKHPIKDFFFSLFLHYFIAFTTLLYAGWSLS